MIAGADRAYAKRDGAAQRRKTYSAVNHAVLVVSMMSNAKTGSVVFVISLNTCMLGMDARTKQTIDVMTNATDMIMKI